ncbi:hypothetical protein BpHYR1_036278 [Brachionus plicatilis]|uniref:Uncharacterized protein n=1 Tax=Brachionus plicatilis TaxID=10195 RepID=A0A3M7P7C1_BRAPC|nr:hypothetical protein BpHYR1_036278 [Brachionus plicatilis]
MSFTLNEFFGNNSNGIKYSIQGDNKIIQTNAKSSSFISLKDLFRTIFLPEGYPNSVSEDYVSYQIWDTIQAFCSSISGALAAKAIFESIGVGDQTATAYGATITWLIKDGTGMAGRIIFAWYQGSSLDSNSKMWRLYADILNDFSFFVDLVTPYFAKSYSIYFISFSGLLRSIVGIAGGATRSALTQHQARQNNLADVSAKDNSQETLVNLVALILNMIILSYVQNSMSLIWILFCVFVMGHLFSNYKAVKAVVMKTFNRNRFRIVCHEYFKQGNILDPIEANKMEPVLMPLRGYFTIDLGANLKKLDHVRSDLSEKLKNNFYWIHFDFKSKKIIVLLNECYSNSDLIKCMFQIELVDFVFKNRGFSSYKNLEEAVNIKDSGRIERESFKIADKILPEFLEKSKQIGWSYEYIQFSPGQFNYSLKKNE